jgi:hypothetical protein
LIRLIGEVVLHGKKKTSYGSPVHRDPRSAWKHLVMQGGLELTGRDEDFEAELLTQLLPSALSLEDALRQVTIDRFLQAFFATARPYVRMFEEILKFFEAAGATRGQHHWRLALDLDTDLDLDHFREQLEQFSSIRGRAELPAFDLNGAWQINQCLDGGKAPRSSTVDFDNHPWPVWLEEWFRAYEIGRYLPLPAARLKAELPAEVHGIVPFISAVAQVAAERGLTYESLEGIRRDRGWTFHSPPREHCAPTDLAEASRAVRSMDRDTYC